MKSIALLLTLILMACGSRDQKSWATSSTENKRDQAESASTVADDITGEWQLVAVTEDKNGNKKLDPEERNSATKMTTDYMKLNRDGSAVFLIVKAKGRYEISTNPDSGERYLNLYSEDNTKYSKGYIMSVTRDELLIMDKTGGDSITIWQRV